MLPANGYENIKSSVHQNLLHDTSPLQLLCSHANYSVTEGII